MSSQAEKVNELCLVRAYQKVDIRPELISWIGFSVSAECYKIITNKSEKPTGYVIWANISKETFRAMIKHECFPKYPYEWNEGNIILILDVVNTSLSFLQLKSLLRELFSSHRVVVFERYGKMKCLSRRGGTYLKKEFENLQYLIN